MATDGSKTGLEPIAERVPIERKIDLSFPNFEDLVTGVSANLSTTGMFIRSDSPESAGTEFGFALRIEEWSPIQGTAKVIWIRPETEGPERPAGMGVEFVDLDAQSRRMIRWLVDKHLQDGGTPFDLETVPAGASKYGAKKKRAGKVRRAGDSWSAAGWRPGAGLSTVRQRALALLVVIVLAAAAYAIYWNWFQDQPGIGALRPPSSRGGAASTGDGAGDPTAEPAPADVTAVAAFTTDAVAGFVQSWAAAWEARDPVAVVALYAEDFAGVDQQGRQAWLDEVQSQLASAEHVRVAVSALDVTFPSADTARASFFRSFRSNRQDRSGRLMLDLISTADGWKIQAEQTLD